MQKQIFLIIFLLGFSCAVSRAEDELSIENPWAPVDSQGNSGYNPDPIDSPSPAPLQQRAAVSRPRASGVSSGAFDAEDFSADIPKAIAEGLEIYKTNGSEAAIRRWVQGGPMENDVAAVNGSSTFTEVENHYGRYLGYQMIESRALSTSSKLVFLQMNYEKGPLFTRFLCYWTGSQWIITGRLSFNTDPTEVLTGKISS